MRIGARGSKLSLVQAGQVRDAIARNLPAGAAAIILPITTSGDQIQDRRLAEIGGKGLFTKEIERKLLDGGIDCAVHSMKDMPAEGPAGLLVAAIPPRADPRDVLVSRTGASLAALPKGARLGTASARRAAQALHARPDLSIVPLRGNVETRLRKLDAGEMEAILLAAAGLQRLGLSARISDFLDPEETPPAPGQGALAIQVREADAAAAWLTGLDDRPTRLCVAAERGALSALEGSCKTAIGAFARIEAERLELTVEALTEDGARRFRRQASVEIAGEDGDARAQALGERLGAEVAHEYQSHAFPGEAESLRRKGNAPDSRS